MKLKKFFAGVLAAAMMLTVGATAAFATEGGNTITINGKNYSDAQTVTVHKTFKLVGTGTSAAETFTLEQVGNGTVTNGDATSAPELGTITGADFIAGAATSAGATADITIALPEYSKTGVYEYTLKEVATNATAGVTYFGNTIRLVVSVVNGRNNTLRVAAVHTEGVGADGEKLSKSDTFTNTYTANTITVTKNVTGNLGDKTKDFKFTINFEKAENEKAPTAITYTVDGVDHTVAFADGKASVEFTLHDGQSLSFVNVPAGVKYTVTEDNYTGTNDGYTTKVDGETALTTGEKTMTGVAATHTFENSKGADIDTGVILDNAPYIALLAIVAIGGVALMLNKRRRDEE